MAADNSTVLDVAHLRISFDGGVPFVAVKDLSFHIGKGETLAIVGESGSGKSLTAMSIMNLLPAAAQVNGKITLATGDGVRELTNMNNASEWQKIRGREAGIVFQEPMSSLNPVMRIGRQIEEAILIHQPINKVQAKELAISWLHKVQLPDPRKIYDRYPHQLSGGQKQRVMIAMAMCNHPALLIADEPTTALDVTVQQEVVRLMQQLRDEHGTAMIFITHDLALAATIADDMLVMYQGEMIEYGSATQILQQPQHPYTKALLACRPKPEQKDKRLPVVSDFLDADRNKSDVAATDIPQYKSDISSDALLDVKNVHVWFAEEKDLLGRTQQYFKAVNDVSFAIHRGEVLGLVGESGCGKSTLSRALMGLLPVHSGQILFEGKDLTRISQQQWRSVRREIQMIFQDPYASLNPRMTIGDMLTEPILTHGIVPAADVRTEAKRLMDLVHLPADALKRYPHQFSGGQRQRIGIARALALRPKLLICDESVSALDVSVQAQILNLLKELQHEFQLTYLFISHDLNVVHYISDRVMVMQTGKIIESGDAEQVLKHPKEAYTRRLIDAMP